MATNSNITVLQKYATKYKNVVYGWDTSHPTTIPKKFIILIYHYLHAVLHDTAVAVQRRDIDRSTIQPLHDPANSPTTPAAATEQGPDPAPTLAITSSAIGNFSSDALQKQAPH